MDGQNTNGRLGWTKVRNLGVVKAVIKKDATQRYTYRNNKKCCVIGGLIKNARIPFPELAQNTTSVGLLPTTILSPLMNHYEMSLPELVELQKINDLYYTTKQRRKALLLRVNQLEHE